MTPQSTFQGALLDADRPTPPGLTDGQGRPAGKRFDVYRNNVAVGLIEAMEAGFPVIAKLVGAEFFRAMAGAFIRQHPPSAPLMTMYGGKFPGWLDTFAPVAHLRYLRDVARIEYARRESYHAADATPVAPDVLGAAPEALMARRFGLAPAVRIVTSRHPALGIWRANAQGAALDRAVVDTLVTRPGYDPVVDALPPGGAAFLRALAKDQPLGAALATAPEGFDLATTLTLALSKGALIHPEHRT